MNEPGFKRTGRVLINHLGFPCRGAKSVIVVDGEDTEFEVQDMALNKPVAMDGFEDFQSVFSGRLHKVESALGDYCVGDFSALEMPGVYRVVLKSSREHSYQFVITDGAFSILPEVFLRHIHNWRSGPYENAWRGPSHMDDGFRTDTEEPIDVVGGWYDAGDVRQWMVHSNLPALALMDAHERIPWHYAEWEKVDAGWSPWLLEARWGLDFMLKMQDATSGMFYEDVGGGRNSRKAPGMVWFYENHSGCYADNADNRFTDNTRQSGDERPVRIQYNPIAQFTSVRILAKAARMYAAVDPDRARSYRAAAEMGWQLGLTPDPRYYESSGLDFAGWTSVRSWRCLAALELFRVGALEWSEVEETVKLLLESFCPKLGFWRNASGSDEPYRGILHSAQPLIALAEVLRENVDNALCRRSREVLRTCLDRYVAPLAAATPFGFIPFGVYSKAVSEGDIYRPWRDGWLYRFFMPANHPQKINHGLSGHWMSWAHGLALVGEVLDDENATRTAWQQIHWLTGQNLHNASLISGIGYNNPMPHSRLMGTFPGGFLNGFCGELSDEPFLDEDANAQWNSTEYWMTPLSNALMSLAILLPSGSPATRKIGTR